MLSKAIIQKIRRSLAKRDERLPPVFAALCDPTRLHIFALLARRRDICVTDVASIFGISIPAASRQLKILERTGLVKRERRGQMVCYEIEKRTPTIRAIIKMVA